uniref:Uncharacterized protein n=1 Tax=Helianthus annuus TaxID=4232 RepID=A0A251VHR9_HELAN
MSANVIFFILLPLQFVFNALFSFSRTFLHPVYLFNQINLSFFLIVSLFIVQKP